LIVKGAATFTIIQLLVEEQINNRHVVKKELKEQNLMTCIYTGNRKVKKRVGLIARSQSVYFFFGAAFVAAFFTGFFAGKV
jgi:hypothetical protein